MNTTPSLSRSGTPRATGREWLGLGVLALPTLLLSLDMSVLYLALPHLAADLRPTGAQTLWIMDVYGFMIAGFLITMGTLGDRIGRRRLLMIGATAFGLASVAAAFSTSAEMLIATRTLMGVAGATLMPSTLALISNMFRDPAQRAVAISVWTSCFMGGTAIGPVVGGVLLQWFWWGSVFLLGVPVMLLLLVCAPLLLPEYRDPAAGRLDLFSVALSLAAILLVVYGLKTAAEGGSGATALGTVLFGTAMGAWFVRRQLRLPDPLLDLRLFRVRSFSAALATMMAGAVAMGGTFLLLSQYLQLVAGNSPLVAGLWLVPPALAMIISTMCGPPLAQRIGRANVIGGGMFVSALGFVLLVFVPAEGGTGMVVLGLLLTSVGLGPGAALIADIVVGSAPREKAGSAASMSETSGEFGIAIGVALLGSLAAAVYRTRVEVPEGATGRAGEEAAQQTLVGAAGTAGELPPQQAAALLESAREAFTAGLNVTAGFGIVAMVVFGAVALRMLRGAGEAVPKASEGPDEAAGGFGEPGGSAAAGESPAQADEPDRADEFVRPAESVQVTGLDADPTGRTR
ncbi:MFS transporter [Nocardiopsis exhalans]|uniref:MFS transporter n=1 Tax=Nocardiopsis exhalans TaxID=163604 RepID=A0ABY5DGY0_9ACTN|nr:MFS transporter [Nocardiopsis exhalans]USY22361.1 MFS transporter [Nocardiopsis exhalans]